MKVLIIGVDGFVGRALATHMFIQGPQAIATMQKTHPEFASLLDKIKIERCVVKGLSL